MRKLLLIHSCLWLSAAALEAQNPWLGLQQLAGTWKNLRSEAAEQWWIAAPDTLKGVGYALTSEGPVPRETMALFRRPNGSIVYRVVVPNQNHGQSVDFALVFFTASSWTFENPEHDFPKTIEYWLVDSTSLRVTLSGDDAEAHELWFSRASESVLQVRPTLRGYEAWVCNRKSGTVERFDAHTGTPMGRLYAGVPAPALYVCSGPDGRAYVLTGGATPSVLRIDPTTGLASAFVQGDGLRAPTGMAFGPDGRLYVCERTGEVLGFDGVSGRLVQTVAEGLPGPVALAWDARGQLLVACSGGRGVWIVPAGDATPRRVTPEGSLRWPTSLCLTSGGDLLVADADEAASIKRFRREGDAWAYAGPVARGFGWPEGLAMGPDGYLYACDSRINALRKIDLAANAELGVYLEGGGLNGPSGVVFRKR
ncbi:MAG: DUF6265 family protein [Saprospiraceae bacterium]|nr:DUF6265 family protein [Saprospiraceae bacterium]MDW8229871.1 DUF6265 family protein [Saprospiraceae bacterium]